MMLDINKLPEIFRTVGFLKYDPFLEYPELKYLGDISERIYGCGYFIGSPADSNYPDFLEKAYFRAAINELISISEIFKDKKIGISIEETHLTLLHFFKELRVTNFHLKSTATMRQKGKAVWLDDAKKNNDLFEIEVNKILIEDCSSSMFYNNNNYKKHYLHSADFNNTISWVDEFQKVWGISHILEAALKQYCELINVAVANRSIAKSGGDTIIFDSNK